jgi:hypothetical protein
MRSIFLKLPATLVVTCYSIILSLSFVCTLINITTTTTTNNNNNNTTTTTTNNNNNTNNNNS